MLGAAWLAATWGAAGPVWGSLGLAILSLAVTHVALSGRHHGLLGLTGGFWAVTAAVAMRGHTYLRYLERTHQAACEAAQERANTLRDASVHLGASDQALRLRLQRYAALRVVTETLSAPPADFEHLLKVVAQQTLRVLDHASQVLVYLVEPPRHELSLRTVQWRRDPAGVVKQKTGDLFDHWVLRQGQPLLVRDVRSDFRFPREAVAITDRPCVSLIAAPMVSAQRVVGVLRAESEAADAFSAEDLRLLGIVADLAAMAIENLRLYVRTAELAITDDLTGLAVHRYFQERLDEELIRVRKTRNPISILLIDLDRFKQYNDTYGHPAGDKLLRTIAQLLRDRVGSGDLIARYGGEEFAVLLSGISHAQALRDAEALRVAVEAYELVLRQGRTRMTVSIGVAAFPQDGDHPESLFRIADQRLYRAKQQGRNRVCGV